MASWKIARRMLTCAALTACLIGGLAQAGDAPVVPHGAPQGAGEPIKVIGSDAGSRFVQLGIGKSVVIDLPRDVKDVLVAEPKFANAVVR